MAIRKFAYANDFLEHLNLALGEPTATGLNTLVAIKPEEISPRKLDLGLKMAVDEELDYQREKQANPNFKRELQHWRTVDGVTVPTESAQWNQAYELAASLVTGNKGLSRLIGGYGNERGNAPTGDRGLEIAANALYDASFGIDGLTGAPLNYKHNAGHLLDFNTHGDGATRPEQARVNKVAQAFDGIEKMDLLEDAREDLAAAVLYSKNPQVITQLLSELPSSKRETKGWNPELNAMKKNAKRWHIKPTSRMVEDETKSISDKSIMESPSRMAGTKPEAERALEIASGKRTESPGDSKERALVINSGGGDVTIGEGVLRSNGNGNGKHKNGNGH